MLRVWPVQVLIRSLYQLYHMNAMRPARYLIESVFQPSEISKWSPHLAASKLSRYLDTRYAALASQRVQLFDGPYSQALAAAKRDLKYLLVYLHAPDHDDTDEFCRYLFVLLIGKFVSVIKGVLGVGLFCVQHSYAPLQRRRNASCGLEIFIIRKLFKWGIYWMPLHIHFWH